MENFYNVIANLGFPIAVTCFLLFRIEKKLDQINSTLVSFNEFFINN